jgi:hypothetical protein
LTLISGKKKSFFTSRNALETLLVVYYDQDFKKESGDLRERPGSVDPLRSLPFDGLNSKLSNSRRNIQCQ